MCSTGMAKPFLGRRRSSIKKEFNEKELQDLRTAFELLDRNRDGRVTTSEFKIMLNNLGINIREDRVEELIRTASYSGKELIDENDFLQFVKQLQQFVPEISSEDVSQDLDAAFKVFDLDGDGFITKDELRIALEMIGESVDETQLDDLLRLADTDRDGKINYEEFTKLLS